MVKFQIHSVHSVNILRLVFVVSFERSDSVLFRCSFGALSAFRSMYSMDEG